MQRLAVSLKMESFYQGKEIFITGGTGFIGKVILEKILRSLVNIQHIYVLIREKKGMSPETRLFKEVIQSPIFDRCRQEQEDFNKVAQKKLIPIAGDICMKSLGISQSDQKKLSHVHVVFHLAATVSFNQPLDEAIEMNCTGTMHLLKLMQTFKNINAFVHVSTAYVNSNKKNCTVEEKIYPMEFDVEETIKVVQNVTSDADLEKLHLHLIGTYPNTYTLTKAMSEHLVAKYCRNIPTVILRPSIVGAAWKEPVPGWVDNVSAAGAIFLAAGFGILTILPGNPRSIADIVPVDIVSNAILVAAALKKPDGEVQVVHCGTSDPEENQLRWRVTARVVEYWIKHPPRRGIFPPKFRMLRSHQNFQLQWFLRYTAPQSVYSTVANALDNKEQMKNAAKLRMVSWKAGTLAKMFQPFTENEWIFLSNRLRKHRAALSDQDLITFDTRSSNVVWERYLDNFCYGLSKWVLHDDVIPVSSESVTHTSLATNTGRMLDWDPDHHAISFPGLFSDISWAYTSSRKPGYTKSGLLGQVMGLTGWKEGANHEASHVPRIFVDEREVVIRTVLQDEKLQQTIAEQAGLRDESVSILEEEAVEMLQKMAANVDYASVRKIGWMMRKIWRNMYEEIIVDEPGLENVRNLVDANDGPLILIPTHRSYVDFLIMSYLFFAYNIPIPYIAAGEDFEKMWCLSGLLRSSGAYFIRRSFQDDPLYSAVFQAYTHYLLLQGHSIEFFIEGTRSRSGKQLVPKMGILGAVINAYKRNSITNAHIVPVSIDYEKPLELMLHQKEMLGEGKVRESLGALLKSGSILSQKFGCISVRFGTPIHLNKYCTQAGKKDMSSHALVSQLAYDITNVMTQRSACMPSHLVATLLLMYRQGISKTQLVVLTNWLRLEVLLRGGHVLCVEGASKVSIVERALELLSSFILRRRRDHIEPAIDQRDAYANMIGLGYYRNKIVHLFDKEGVVAVSHYAISNLKESCETVLQSTLLQRSAFVFTLLAREFVRSPQMNVENEMEKTLELMISRSILIPVKNNHIAIAPAGESMHSLLCAMIWPFIDSYWVAVMSLFALHPPNNCITHGELTQRMMWLAETLYHESVIAYYESCSIETLNNAIGTLRKMHVVEIIDGQRIRLTEAYQAVEPLRALAAQISEYRKVPLASQQMDHERLNHLFAEFPVLAKL